MKQGTGGERATLRALFLPSSAFTLDPGNREARGRKPEFGGAIKSLRSAPLTLSSLVHPPDTRRGCSGRGAAQHSPAAARALAFESQASRVLATAAFPPSAADQTHSVAVAPDLGAQASWGIQTEEFGSLSRPSRRAGPPETGREGRLKSVPRRPQCEHSDAALRR